MFKRIWLVIQVALLSIVYGMLLIHEGERGAIDVPSAAEIAKKWAEVTPGRVNYYQVGVAKSGQKWEQKTSNAGAAFKAAVSAGNIQQMFVGGVKRATAAKYTEMAVGKGPGRFSEGIGKSQKYMESGMAPMVEAISGVDLGDRFPRGNAGNRERSVKVQVALNAKRLALRAAGA